MSRVAYGGDVRELPRSAFPGDDGAPEESVRAALARAAAEPGPVSYLAAIAELCLTRMLVPVVATGPDPTGAVEEHSALSVVLLASAGDGDRTGMLAFTGLDALHRWDPSGRPVLVTLDAAAGSAAAEGADSLLVDLAGPHPLEISGDVLAELAAGHRLVALGDGGFGWAVPAPTSGPAGAGDAREMR